MGRPNQLTHIDSTTAAPASTATPAARIISTGWPVGDLLYKRLLLKIRSKMSAATAMVTDGRFNFLDSLTFETDKHGLIIEGLDGQHLRAISICALPNGAGHRDVDATIADSAHVLQLPFLDMLAARPDDTVLDMLKAKPKLTMTFGAPSRIESTGGTTLSNLDSYIDAEVDPGPVDTNKDGPLFMPYWGVQKEAVAATASGKRFSLPYGDRIYKRIYICQRKTATRAALDNTVTGTNEADAVSLKVNGFPWVDRIPFRQIQEWNRQDYPQFASVLGAKGIAVLDFQKRLTGGAKLSDGLSVVSRDQGRVDVEVDVTSVTEGSLDFVMECVKPIPAAAQRPAPEPQK